MLETVKYKTKKKGRRTKTKTYASLKVFLSKSSKLLKTVYCKYI